MSGPARQATLCISTLVTTCFRTCSNPLLLCSVCISVPHERGKNPDNPRDDISRKMGQEHFQNGIYAFMKISVLRRKTTGQRECQRRAAGTLQETPAPRDFSPSLGS